MRGGSGRKRARATAGTRSRLRSSMRLNDHEVKHKQCGIDKLGSLGASLDRTRLVQVVPESKLALASIAIGMIPEVMSADCTRTMDDQRSLIASHLVQG